MRNLTNGCEHPKVTGWESLAALSAQICSEQDAENHRSSLQAWVSP